MSSRMLASFARGEKYFGRGVGFGCFVRTGFFL